MYRPKDLKKLKKIELLKLAKDQKFEKLKKNDLIEHLVGDDIGVSLPKTPRIDSIELPVAIDDDCLYYELLTDARLPSIPYCSFMQLYTYCCGNDDSSVKALDRAVKHSSAGDVNDVRSCQVYILQRFVHIRFI